MIPTPHRPRKHRRAACHGRRAHHRRGPLLLLVAFACGGCDVSWGGGRLALEDPSPPEPEQVEEGEAPPAPLPEGPLLYLARLLPDGRGVLAPIARIESDSLGAAGPAEMSLASPVDDEYRQRFDTAFLHPGLELALVARGRRVGSLLVEGPAGDRGNCVSLARAQAFLPPGASVPEIGFGVPLKLAPARGGVMSPAAPSSRMVTFGPVLAEQLLRAAGVARPFLAQRSALETVAGEDTVAAMTATYLINDSLAAGPPRGDAASLFFMARYESTRGFVPVWSEVRSYGTPNDKEAFAYLDWFELAGSRFDFLRVLDDSSERLVSSRAPDNWRDRLELAERQFEWTEPATCPVLGRLEEASAG